MTAKQKPLNIPEKVIENSILSYLKREGVFVFKVESQGTYDQKKGIYRLKKSQHRMRGVADIVGIFKGIPLYIEVKSAKGRLSEHQKAFLDRVNQEGGIAFVARSVDEVRERLRL